MTKKHPLIVIAGPTAVGKTAISLQLAKQIDGAIVSADSVQVYRGMDIGSAKASIDERRTVDHYLIDCLEPKEGFSVQQFQIMAKEAIATIQKQGKLPILVGGTGFYIRALLYDVDFSEHSTDKAVRQDLKNRYDDEGIEKLYAELVKADPESANVIHMNNHKRVLRALEYYYLTGEKISVHNGQQRQKESPYHFLFYVIDMARERLYDRINQRVEQMMVDGLEQEVRQLSINGLQADDIAMQALGYKEVLDYLDAPNNRQQMIDEIKKNTRHFAKRQLTWFRREKEVEWLKMEDYDFDLVRIVNKIANDVEENGLL